MSLLQNVLIRVSVVVFGLSAIGYVAVSPTELRHAQKSNLLEIRSRPRANKYKQVIPALILQVGIAPRSDYSEIPSYCPKNMRKI